MRFDTLGMPRLSLSTLSRCMFTARYDSNFVLRGGITEAPAGSIESRSLESDTNPVSCVRVFSFSRILSQAMSLEFFSTIRDF